MLGYKAKTRPVYTYNQMRQIKRGIKMESIKQAWDGGVRTLFFDVNNVKGMVLTQEELKKVIANKGNLSGATLAPEVVVNGLRFDFVKMDAAMLCLLGNKGADLRGADLSHQDFTGARFNYVDLSHVICTQTIFSQAEFNNVNLTGVKLHTAVGVPGVPMSVIFSEEDRLFYVERDKNRLLFVLNRENCNRANDNDPFYTLPYSATQALRKSVLHPVGNDWLNYFKWSDEYAAQSILRNGEFDDRSAMGNAAKSEEAKEKLLGNGFNDAQKTLFHHARAASWVLRVFPEAMLEERLITVDESTKEKVLTRLYIDSQEGGPRHGPQLAEALFTAVFPYSTYEYDLNLTDEEITAVRELFLSPDYQW